MAIALGWSKADAFGLSPAGWRWVKLSLSNTLRLTNSEMGEPGFPFYKKAVTSWDERTSTPGNDTHQHFKGYITSQVLVNNPQSCLSNPSILLVKVPKYCHLEEQCTTFWWHDIEFSHPLEVLDTAYHDSPLSRGYPWRIWVIIMSPITQPLFLDDEWNSPVWYSLRLLKFDSDSTMMTSFFFRQPNSSRAGL